jgi:hypothetical protein
MNSTFTHGNQQSLAEEEHVPRRNGQAVDKVDAENGRVNDPNAIAAARDTAMNPAVLDAFAPAIIAGWETIRLLGHSRPRTRFDSRPQRGGCNRPVDGGTS